MQEANSVPNQNTSDARAKAAPGSPVGWLWQCHRVASIGSRVRSRGMLDAAMTAVALLMANTAHAALEELVVTATLQEADAERASITVFDEQIVTKRAAQHLEDLLSAAPNTNVASGASRGRFIQIRGIGERSQFVEPINASVAMLLDGIDLTGLGGAATTWDLEQIEVLRGPQGTLLGANALAGLINLRSTPADAEGSARLSAGIENYSGYRLGAAFGGHLGGGWSGRLAVQQYESDGYTENRFLSRDDTSNRDELTGRVSLAWTDDQQRLDLGLYRVDVDNGYDAFSLDNTRETLADQPGSDALTTDAARIRYQRDGAVNLMTQVSIADTSTDYSFDEDWSYVGIAPGWEYSSFDRYLRDRTMQSVEFRADDELDSATWVAGVYLRREQESLERRYTYLSGPFTSDLDIDTSALFGQIDVPLSYGLAFYVGARVEKRDADYRDSDTVAESLSDTLWSGRIGLDWDVNDSNGIYLGLSRGVRSGGVNANLRASLDSLPAAGADQLAGLGTFDEESLLNAELGWRWRNAQGTLQSDVTLFIMDRNDQQVGRSITVPRGDGSTAFIDYTDNAAEGTNQGLEWQFGWQASSGLTFSGSLGLLDAHFDTYVTALGEDISGRDQPQSPRAMGQLATEWQASPQLSFGLEVTAMDSYYFSDRHDTRSPGRELLNAHAEWQKDAWRLVLWGRNLTDDDYFVRGFGSFGNDPRKEYVVEPYFQYGEPRVMGATIEYQI